MNRKDKMETVFGSFNFFVAETIATEARGQLLHDDENKLDSKQIKINKYFPQLIVLCVLRQ